MNRKVWRDKRTGRFTKNGPGYPRKNRETEEVPVSQHVVVVARGRRGRFVKRETARRHPDRTTTERITRGGDHE